MSSRPILLPGFLFPQPSTLITRHPFICCCCQCPDWVMMKKMFTGGVYLSGFNKDGSMRCLSLRGNSRNRDLFDQIQALIAAADQFERMDSTSTNFGRIVYFNQAGERIGTDNNALNSSTKRLLCQPDGTYIRPNGRDVVDSAACCSFNARNKN
uniref:Uncharacterized protein n=1 Tax=Ditylenchus dipsaci TaxID=166011 RepID=A0A915EF49_9BILA